HASQLEQGDGRGGADASVHLGSFHRVAHWRLFARLVRAVRTPGSGEPKSARRRSRAMEALAATVLPLPDSRVPSSMSRKHAHLSDEALVALVARGDESALAELYDRVGRVAY